MNKLSSFKVLIFFLIATSGCSNKIVLRRTDSSKPVIVRMNKEIQKVNGVLFPIVLTIENTTLSKKEFGQIIYEYGFHRRGYGIELYLANKLISNNQLKVVRGRQSIEYLVYTRHAFDTTNMIHEELQPYMNKMLELNQDTLHIGTVNEFREKHPELFNLLTENDTISISYLKGKDSGLGERIAIPVNW
ncbi:MAG: hypothetical protein JW922_10595 [Paludibacteraceae bacterium]|nr:hypothetical protein [Paludibacteraceae bacterium]